MCGERSPAVRVEFRDEECGEILMEAVAEALRGVPRLGRVVRAPGVPGQPPALHAWDSERPLFVEDAEPDSLENLRVPSYDRKFHVLDDNTPKVDETAPPKRSALECFNCDGPHTLRDCPHRKDFVKINRKKNDMKSKNIRYHADDQIQLGNKIPGKISKNLRRALGLGRYQLPLHVYKMRTFGYPPGWLLHAKVSHSGLELFDSQGAIVKNPDEEEGEHPESKDRYDIKKILSFPGFNTRPSSKYIDESEILGYPPLSKEHSKMAMLDRLAPIAAKAYRRKKMSETKIGKVPCDEQTHEDMDLDDDSDEFCDGETSEPFVPPLPIEVLPPLPPPDSLPPSPLTELPCLPPDEIPPTTAEVVNSDVHSVDANNINIDRDSPTLTDLNQQKVNLLAILENNDKITTNLDSDVKQYINSPDSSKNLNQNKCGNVLGSNLGTPIFDISPFSKLPNSNSFSKDICDLMNFENLPNSIGKYEQMSGVIKKVREAVSKLQEYDV